MNPKELNERIQNVASDAAEYIPIEGPTIGPVLLNMADVQPKSVLWLWLHRFARGRLSLLVGRAGLGKSFLTLDMAARISNGSNWPDGESCEAGSVLLISCEDDPGDTIRVRLDAAGANVHKIQLLKAVQTIDPDTDRPREVPFTLQDVLEMEAALKSMPDCRLVIIDPIGSYLGGGTDAHRDNEVRSVLAPVAALAEKYDVAVLIVAHNRKAPAKYADDTAMGSRAFTGIVRSSWHLMSDEEDPDRRMLLPGKNNLSKTAPGMAFRIEPDETGRDGTARVAWEDALIDMHADDAMALASELSGPGPDPTERNEAAQWLIDALTDGRRPAKELFSQAEKDGISKGTLKRAKKELGVISGKDGMTGGWTWHLPNDGREPDQIPITCAPSDKPAPLLDNKRLTDDKTPVDSTEGNEEAQVPVCGETEPPSNRLNPDRPGPVDLLNAEQRKKYMAIYHSRPPSMSPDEKHERAWRAATTEKEKVN